MSEAGHDARCEREYTPNGFIFIDCLCSLRKAKAEVWDECHQSVCVDLIYSARDWCGHLNPYATTPPPNPSTTEGD